MRVNKLIGRSAGLALCFMSIVSPAKAAYTIVIKQVGGNIVADGSGTINTSALGDHSGILPEAGLMAPSYGEIFVGPAGHGAVAAEYFSGISGPRSFGSGVDRDGSSGTGNIVGIWDSFNGIFVPPNYTSGAPLSSETIWTASTLSSLGITPGTYTWTWGSGSSADSFTLTTSPMPEPSSWATLILGLGAMGAVLRRRRLPYQR